MKLLFDFLPIILFFTTFKVAEGRKDWAAQFASDQFGFMVNGGVVGPNEAPVLLATVVVILATLAQVGWIIARGRKVDTMLWISLAIIVVFGGATLFFHDATFIKWKPTVLYWLFAVTLAGSALFMKRNLIRVLMQEQVQLPEPVWSRLNASWIAFFAFMGILNLYVAYSYSEDTWVSFKLYGGMGLMFLFVLGQGAMLSRHIEEKNS